MGWKYIAHVHGKGDPSLSIGLLAFWDGIKECVIIERSPFVSLIIARVSHFFAFLLRD